LSGIKGRSGRRKPVSALVAEALDVNEGNLPAYLGRLETIALNRHASPKDRVEAIEYLINRALGAPKATTDLRIKAVPRLTAEELVEAVRIPQMEEKKLIEQYSNLPVEGTVNHSLKEGEEEPIEDGGL
jgi:hypothetical protein